MRPAQDRPTHPRHDRSLVPRVSARRRVKAARRDQLGHRRTDSRIRSDGRRLPRLPVRYPIPSGIRPGARDPRRPEPVPAVAHSISGADTLFTSELARAQGVLRRRRNSEPDRGTFPLWLRQHPRWMCELPTDYREPMRQMIVIAVALTVLGSAACSSGDDDADPTTTDAPSTSGASTAPTVESTEPERTTTAPQRPRSTTASAHHDDRPHRSPDRRHRSRPERRRTGLAWPPEPIPSNPALRAELEKYFAGDALASSVTYLDGLVADGLRGRPSPTIPRTSSSFESCSLRSTSASERGRALPGRCRPSSYEPVGDGSEAIVNDRDRHNTSRRHDRASRTDIWQLRDGGEAFEIAPRVPRHATESTCSTGAASRLDRARSHCSATAVLPASIASTDRATGTVTVTASTAPVYTFRFEWGGAAVCLAGADSGGCGRDRGERGGADAGGVT